MRDFGIPTAVESLNQATTELHIWASFTVWAAFNFGGYQRAHNCEDGHLPPELEEAAKAALRRIRGAVGTPTRHPDCDALEALLGPLWAVAGHHIHTDGLSAAYNEADQLFSIELDYPSNVYTVRDAEGSILHTAATLDGVASILQQQV